MSIDTLDQASPIVTTAKIGRIETDLFCHGCGYNLHGQIVTPDDRLGFMLCRCPECGRHHPAGFGTTAASVWLTRLGTILLLIWIGIVLAFAILSLFGLGGFQAGYVNEYLWFHWQTAANGSLTPGINNSYYDLNSTPGTDPNSIPGWGPAICIYLFSGFLGFFLGSLLVIMLWHWPRRRYLLAMILPILTGAFLLSLPFADREYDHVRGFCVRGVALIMLIEIAGMILGIRFGRPLARAIIRSIIPPRPRQFLAYLWTVDNKSQPATKSF